MKTYKGTAKVKDDSTYVYKGHTLEVTGVYMEYKNGNGNGVFPDGAREYKLNLIGTEFSPKYGTMTVIDCSQLENIELFETLELPLDEAETLQLIEFSQKYDSSISSKGILEAFIFENTKQAVLPYIDLTTLYDEDEFIRRNKLKVKL